MLAAHADLVDDGPRPTGGRFSFRPKIGVGVYTVIARTAADARTVAGASAPLQITH